MAYHQHWDEFSSDEDDFELIDGIGERNTDLHGEKTRSNNDSATSKVEEAAPVTRSEPQNLILKEQLEQCQREKQQLEQQVRAQQQEVNARDQIIEQLQMSIDQAKEESTKQQTLALREKEILEERAAIHNDVIEAKDAENGRLLDELAECKRKNDMLKSAAKKVQLIDLSILTTGEKALHEREQVLDHALLIIFIVDILATAIFMFWPKWIFCLIPISIKLLMLFLTDSESCLVRDRAPKIKSLLATITDFKNATDAAVADRTYSKSKNVKAKVTPKPKKATCKIINEEEVESAIVELVKGSDGLFGFTLIGTSVSTVQPETSAEEELVLEGDEIISINGMDAETLSAKKIKKILTESDRITLQLRYNPHRLEELKMTSKCSRKY